MTEPLPLTACYTWVMFAEDGELLENILHYADQAGHVVNVKVEGQELVFPVEPGDTPQMIDRRRHYERRKNIREGKEDRRQPHG